MNWFNENTSIAGIQIPNWVIVLRAAVIVIFISMRRTSPAQTGVLDGYQSRR
jgi:hypothetical protein